MGIILIATGERNYGEMAFNLAVSLRLSMPKVPISCISDGCIRSVPMWADFIDQIIDVPRGSNPFEIKTRLYELTPYRETFYIDVDSILNNDHNLKAILDSLKGVDLGMIEYKRAYPNAGKISYWTTAQTVFDHYKIPPKNAFPVYNSSLIYFKKTKNNRLFFKEANKSYNNKSRDVKSIGRQYPDEIAFGAASALTGHYPTENIKHLCYFNFVDYYNVSSPGQVKQSYPFISLAGSKVSGWMQTLYNGQSYRNSEKIGSNPYKFNLKKKAAWS